MTTKASPLKRAIKVFKQVLAGQRYGTTTNPLKCPLCANDLFKTGQYLAMLNMHTLACTKCSHVMLFAKSPKMLAN